MIYEDQVLIDSGASDSMEPSFKYLDYITPCYATILLADGAMHNSDFQGLMRVQVTDHTTAKRMVIPVMNTLLVPGIATILWAASGLTEGFSTVSIRMHVNTDHSFTIRLRHLLLSNNGVLELPFPFTGMSSAKTPSKENKHGKHKYEECAYDRAPSPIHVDSLLTDLILLEKLYFAKQPLDLLPSLRLTSVVQTKFRPTLNLLLCDTCQISKLCNSD